jgi:N-acetyl-gamma-glutamyl-phosphate/LysW-gamma-L-alpha-aminoadipyl-6-phosphate reductase
MIAASIVGGSGYAGGELLRLLLGHPKVKVRQVTSERFARRFVHGVHPNLRGLTQLKFAAIDELKPCDVLFLALPHGQAAARISHFAGLSEKLIDLSSDFRLRDSESYQNWYGQPHPQPEWLGRFVYGLPELHPAELSKAQYISGVGCNATATILALWPLASQGLINKTVVEVKVGSSEGGNRHSLASHHPERAGCVRSFAPTGHRHQAEILQELGDFELHFSATAVELVRGVLCTAHVFLNQDLAEKDIWHLFRTAYTDQRFVRLVKDRRGAYRYPEPKILAGTNFCDVGFEKDPRSNRLVVISALDNLMKGAAGTAVQALNLTLGWPEDSGLCFPGLHPA